MARTITKEKVQEIRDEAIKHLVNVNHRLFLFRFFNDAESSPAHQRHVYNCITPEACEKYSQAFSIIILISAGLSSWQRGEMPLGDAFLNKLYEARQLLDDAQEMVMSAIGDKYRAIADEFNLTKKTHYADKAMFGWKPLFGKRRRGILEIERDRREFEGYARKIVEDLKVIAHEMPLAISAFQQLKGTKMDINTQDTGTSIDAGDDQNPHIPQVPAFMHRDRDASSA